jgi:plastocyanin
MNRWLALLLACLALTLVAAGCGDDDDDGGGGGEQNSEQPAEQNGGGGGGEQNSEQPAEQNGGGGGGGEQGGGGAEVKMEGIEFNPAEVSVSKGDTVTWVNEDSVGHDVTGDSFKSGDPGGLQNGDTFKFTFKKAGTFDYVCTVHPGMDGSVVVK